MRTSGLALFILFLNIHQAAAQADAGDSAVATSTAALSLIEAPVPVKAHSQAEFQKTRGRVFDKKFVAVMGTLGAAESLRFTTRQLVLENEMAAGAPWVTSTPSHTELVLKYAPIFAAELAVAYELKKPHDWLPGDRIIRRLWWAYPAAMTVLHVKNSIGNIRTSAPADTCPPQLCQMP